MWINWITNGWYIFCIALNVSLSFYAISPLYINGKLPFFVSKERFENGVNKLVFSCLVDSSQIILVKGNYKMSKGGLLWDY